MTPARAAARTALLIVAIAPAGVADPAGLHPEGPLDPHDLPDAPAPPTMPDLTHRALSIGVEATVASIRPNPSPDAAASARRIGWIERVEAEQALSIRRWYAGVAHEAALGRLPRGGGGATVVVGHPELWGRAVWASREGLAFGGGLGVVPPIAQYEAGEYASDVVQEVRVVRPWDYVHFADHTVTVRPFLDVRAIDGRVILQLRQGLDWSNKTRTLTNAPDATLTSRTTLYAGYRAARYLGVGIEVWEVYFVRAPDVPDEQRAVYAVSPGVRVMTGVLQPSLALIFPVDRPLFGQVDSYWGLRMSMAVVVE